MPATVTEIVRPWIVTEPDGRAVVFARTYDPIFIVRPDGRVLPAVGGWVRDATHPARYFFHEGAPWHGTRDHARVHALFLALNRAAAATGYGQPPPRPDLLDWLREQALEPVTLSAPLKMRRAA